MAEQSGSGSGSGPPASGPRRDARSEVKPDSADDLSVEQPQAPRGPDLAAMLRAHSESDAKLELLPDTGDLIAPRPRTDTDVFGPDTGDFPQLGTPPGFAETKPMPPADPLAKPAPGFADPAQPKPAVDPWTDVTPTDLPEEQVLREASTDVGVRVHRPAAREPEIVSPEDDDADRWSGDGPFAAPVDGPKTPSRPSREAKETRERPRLPPRTVSEIARANAFSSPLMVQRRVQGRAPSNPGATVIAPAQPTGLVPRSGSTAGPMTQAEMRVPQRRAQSNLAQPSSQQPERRYPKMRALLSNPDEVPHGGGAREKPRPPPVPGTFFPTPRQGKEVAPMRAEPADLDEMLATMAEGLMIGEDASGQTEVRVTLRDEFFAGTELRIVAGGGRVRAVLVPPDRGTYLTLNGNIDELRVRLESRGLHIEELRVAEP